jgi:hypothetical protein
LTTAFTFHSHRHATAALSAAAAAGESVTLVTPLGAAGCGGPEFYWEIYRGACTDVPDATSEVVIDCGEDAGTAMRALRCGWRQIVLRADPVTTAKIEDMAAKLGGTVLRTRPTAIDLTPAGDPMRFCRQAFSNQMNTTRRES